MKIKVGYKNISLFLGLFLLTLSKASAFAKVDGLDRIIEYIGDAFLMPGILYSFVSDRRINDKARCLGAVFVVDFFLLVGFLRNIYRCIASC